MENLSAVARPVTIRDMSIAFGLKPASLDALMRRYRILPACRIGRTRCYGGVQVRRVAAALGCTGQIG
jgi:hypothetical protein